MGVTDFAINTVYFTLRVYQFTPQSISHIERIKSHWIAFNTLVHIYVKFTPESCVTVGQSVFASIARARTHTHRCVGCVGCVGCALSALGAYVRWVCAHTHTHIHTYMRGTHTHIDVFPFHTLFTHTCDTASIAGIRLVWQKETRLCTQAGGRRGG